MCDNWRGDPGMLEGGRETKPGNGVEDRLTGTIGTLPKIVPLLHNRTSRTIPTTTNASCSDFYANFSLVVKLNHMMCINMRNGAVNNLYQSI